MYGINLTGVMLSSDEYLIGRSKESNPLSAHLWCPDRRKSFIFTDYKDAAVELDKINEHLNNFQINNSYYINIFVVDCPFDLVTLYDV